MKRRQIPWVLTLLLALALLCQACKDPDSPKSDDEFYCKVDGKHWRPDSDGDFKKHTLISDLMDDGKTLYIRAIDAKSDQTISMIIADTSGIDTVNLGKIYVIGINTNFPNNPPSGNFYKPVSQNTVKEVKYVTDATHKGTFRILGIERDRRVLTSFKLRAEFEFTAVSPSGEIVKITDGKFYNWVRISQ